MAPATPALARHGECGSVGVEEMVDEGMARNVVRMDSVKGSGLEGLLYLDVQYASVRVLRLSVIPQGGKSDREPVLRWLRVRAS